MPEQVHCETMPEQVQGETIKEQVQSETIKEHVQGETIKEQVHSETMPTNEIKPTKKSQTISELIQHGLEVFMRHVIFWESDDKKVGMMIQLMHHAFVYGMVAWYIYLHTFSDSYVQYALFCFIFFLVWVQHLFCRACLFFNIEQKLIGDHPNIIDNILHIFHITPNAEIGNGILLIVSSLIMTMLFSELVFRTISIIKYWI